MHFAEPKPCGNPAQCSSCDAQNTYIRHHYSSTIEVPLMMLRHYFHTYVQPYRGNALPRDDGCGHNDVLRPALGQFILRILLAGCSGAGVVQPLRSALPATRRSDPATPRAAGCAGGADALLAHKYPLQHGLTVRRRLNITL